MICHYFFFNHVFKFQDSVCNGCHHLSKTCLIKVTAVISIENAEYCCIIHKISKSEATNLLENAVLKKFGYI